MIVVKPGLPENQELVEEISSQAFSKYGDYGTLIPKFFATKGVHSFIAWDGDQAVGFALMGFLPWTGADTSDDWWIADLLAIAVDVDYRRRRVGTELMKKVMQLVQEMSGWREIKEIQLTSASDNEPALKFFKGFGFEVKDRFHGKYSSGQDAWRLVHQAPFIVDG